MWFLTAVDWFLVQVRACRRVGGGGGGGDAAGGDDAVGGYVTVLLGAVEVDLLAFDLLENVRAGSCGD